MNELIIQVLLYVVIILNIFLGVVIYTRSNQKRIKILFSFIAFFSSFWAISIVGFYSDLLSVYEVNWIIFSHIAGLVIPFIFFNFSLFFKNRILNNNILPFIALIPIFIFIYLLIFTDKIVGARIGESAYELGNYYIPYSLAVIVFFILGYISLVKQYSISESIAEKVQIKYVFTGSLIASTLALIPDLVMPYFGIFEYTWLGPIFTSVMVFSIFIAILKHNLFNIKAIITEFVVVLIIFALLIELFLSKTTTEVILRCFILILVTLFSYILVKSVYKEIEARLEIERLAGDLRIANERLKELDKLKSEFVSIASHQLRSPLTAIKGYASLIKDGSFGKVPPGIADAIDRIFNSSQALVLMVEDFLNISRIEQGRMKYEFEALEMSSLIEEIIAELKPSVEKANLALSFSTDKQEPYCIKADKGKIRQVVSNLIDNAVKYTPKGSISVTLSKKPAHGKILLAVSDTGIGIDAETLPNLFAKFSRAKDANKVNVIGTGLGLYIVKEIVNGHKGRVWAESAGKNKGSSFFVELAEDSEAIHATRVADFAKTM